MTVPGGVRTAYFLPKTLKADGTIVYYVVCSDGAGYYINLGVKQKKDVTDKQHLFIKENELVGNIYQLFGKEV